MEERERSRAMGGERVSGGGRGERVQTDRCPFQTCVNPSCSRRWFWAAEGLNGFGGSQLHVNILHWFKYSVCLYSSSAAPAPESSEFAGCRPRLSAAAWTQHHDLSS